LGLGGFGLIPAPRTSVGKRTGEAGDTEIGCTVAGDGGRELVELVDGAGDGETLGTADGAARGTARADGLAAVRDAVGLEAAGGAGARFCRYATTPLRPLATICAW
jgi:hypothetical protein